MSLYNTSSIFLAPLVLALRGGIDILTDAHTERAICVRPLGWKHTFRSIYADKWRLRELRIFIKSFTLIWRGRSLPGSVGSELLLGGVAKKEGYLKYVSEIDGFLERNYIDAESPPCVLKLVEKLFLSLVVVILWPAFSVCGRLKKNPAISLFPLEYSEIVLILAYVRAQKYKKVYYLFSYECHSNIISYCISKVLGVEVIRIPSPNSLFFYYSQCYADEFYFTSPFQLGEYEKMKAQWVVGRLRRCKARGMPDRAEIEEQLKAESEYTYGFLSSGHWLRAKQGSIQGDIGVKSIKAEVRLINWINEYIERNPTESGVIYTHPIERVDSKQCIQTKEYYASISNNKMSLSYIRPQMDSRANFHKVKILLSVDSTSIVEALFYGKIAAYALRGGQNFVRGELEKIRFSKKEDLFNFLDKYKEAPEEDFFGDYNIRDYRYDSLKDEYLEL